MTDRHDPTDNPAFTSAICGATLPGMTCHWEHPGYVAWYLSKAEGSDFAATPCWEGVDGIYVSITRGSACYSDVIPCEFSGDGVEDAHLYLAAMRRWQRTLPTLYARWDCDPDTDWVGNIVELCEEFDGSNLWEPIRWDGVEECSLLDILDEWSTYPARFNLVSRGDNMVIRTSPFPPCECCGR